MDQQSKYGGNAYLYIGIIIGVAAGFFGSFISGFYFKYVDTFDPVFYTIINCAFFGLMITMFFLAIFYFRKSNV